jgi:hypothetical protein
MFILITSLLFIVLLLFFFFLVIVCEFKTSRIFFELLFIFIIIFVFLTYIILRHNPSFLLDSHFLGFLVFLTLFFYVIAVFVVLSILLSIVREFDEIYLKETLEIFIFYMPFLIIFSAIYLFKAVGFFFGLRFFFGFYLRLYLDCLYINNFYFDISFINFNFFGYVCLFLFFFVPRAFLSDELNSNYIKYFFEKLKQVLTLRRVFNLILFFIFYFLFFIFLFSLLILLSLYIFFFFSHFLAFEVFPYIDQILSFFQHPFLYGFFFKEEVLNFGSLEIFNWHSELSLTNIFL